MGLDRNKPEFLAVIKASFINLFLAEFCPDETLILGHGKKRDKWKKLSAAQQVEFNRFIAREVDAELVE